MKKLLESVLQNVTFVLEFLAIIVVLYLVALALE